MTTVANLERPVGLCRGCRKRRVPGADDLYCTTCLESIKQERQAARRALVQQGDPQVRKLCELCGVTPVDAEGHDICGACVMKLSPVVETAEEAEERAHARRWESAPAGVIGPAAARSERSAAARAGARPDMIGALARRQRALGRF